MKLSVIECGSMAAMSPPSDIRKVLAETGVASIKNRANAASVFFIIPNVVKKFFIFQFSITSLKIHGLTMVDTLKP